MTDFARIRRNVDKMISLNAPDTEIEAYLGDEGVTPDELRVGGKIDVQTGAPFKVRGLVGAVTKPEDRLKTIQQFFPSAQPYGPENFIYKNPEGPGYRLYNPPGLDPGDIYSLGREAAQMGGGTAGMAAGAAAGAPGGPLGMMAGATIGGILGTAGAEEAAGLMARQAGAAETRTLPERLGETAFIGLAGGAGGPAGAMTGQAVRGAPKVLMRGFREGREEAQQAIDDLARFGVTPSTAQVTGRSAMDSIESWLAGIPGSAGRFRKVVADTTDKVKRSLEAKIATATGRSYVDPEMAGRTLKRGINQYAARFREAGGELYDKLDEFVAVESPVSTSNFTRALSEGTIDIPEVDALLRSPLVRKLEGVIPTEMEYGVLKQIRSAVGRKLSSPSLMDDATTGELKSLYGAITDDMRAAAQRYGGEKAVKAWERADWYWRSGMQRIEETLEPLVKGKVFEDVFLTMERAGRRGATRLRAVYKGLTPDQRNIVTGAVIKRMGRAVSSQQDEVGDVFSFETFLTNWNKIDEKTKDVLFQNTLGLKQDLNALARSARRVRESSQAFRNPSGTAGALIGRGMILGGAGGAAAGAMFGNSLTSALAFPLGLGGIAIGANATSRLLTSPAFVRWLARSTRIQPNGAAAHMGRLSGIAAGADPGLKEAIHDYMRALTIGEPGVRQR